MGSLFTLLAPRTNTTSQNITVAKLLYIICLGFAKLGMTWPIRNIYSRLGDRRPVHLCNILLGAEVVWTIASLIVLSAGCSPNHILPTVDQPSCAYGSFRWGVVVFFDCFTELAFVALALALLTGLHSKLKEKVVVMVAFALRLA